MKVVYDTCLYVDLLRSAAHMELFSDRNCIRYLSPIVLMELRAGGTNSKAIRALDRLVAPYFKAGRILTLEPAHYYSAGVCVSKLNLKNRSSRAITHDILIALSAQSKGAVLFTSNKKDFERIREHVPLKIEYV